MSERQAIEAMCETNLVIETTIDGIPRFVQVFPLAGASAPAGLCADYDHDCFQMTQAQRIACFLMEPGDCGSCPFVD